MEQAVTDNQKAMDVCNNIEAFASCMSLIFICAKRILQVIHVFVCLRCTAIYSNVQFR